MDLRRPRRRWCHCYVVTPRSSEMWPWCDSRQATAGGAGEYLSEVGRWGLWVGHQQQRSGGIVPVRTGGRRQLICITSPRQTRGQSLVKSWSCKTKPLASKEQQSWERGPRISVACGSLAPLLAASQILDYRHGSAASLEDVHQGTRRL